MKRRILTTVGLALAMLVAFAPARAQVAKSWIHVHVTEPADGTKVRVNVPLSLAQVALDVAPKDILEKGQLKLQQKDISVADLRRLWAELKASGDADFVTVEEDDKFVRVSRQGQHLNIDVQDREEKKERVVVRMPLTVVDALLSGEGETLNIQAAISQLEGQRGEIVTVESSDSQVRIWIDENKG